MSFWDLFKKKKSREATETCVAKIEVEESPQEEVAFHNEESLKAFRLFEEAQADTEYQKQITKYIELMTQIQEAYSVINNVGSFLDDAGDALIEKCVEAMNIEMEIREKQEYYNDCIFNMSQPCKTLAMIFEKRGEFQRAATICVYAIENGYTSDGTKGGMKGRLARMIKKGSLPLTDNLKKILDL